MVDLGPLHAWCSFVAGCFRESRLSARRLAILVPAVLLCLSAAAQAPEPKPHAQTLTPPRVLAARRFLAQRGNPTRSTLAAARARNAALRPQASTAANGLVWQPLGPAAVLTPTYGLVSGRVTAAAFDPSDSTGNRVFIGTTGGGIWFSQNAASTTPSAVQFTPLTDNLSALAKVPEASISIGALAIQPPGGTGVILAGTGDPNDALDSYYGAGILRSTDGGANWSLIKYSADKQWIFAGEGFAGFAWRTDDPQYVVAAVSQARDSLLIGAEVPNYSYGGLYYSTDGGADWSLSVIRDGSTDVQGPNDQFDLPNGNSATAIVWNAKRGIFIAAIRNHGFYQSSDYGRTFTRLTSQPGQGLTPQICPPNPGFTGSIACPIFRGALAVNPDTGDTFAWFVDAYNQDQGIWRDSCALTYGVCSNPTVSFATKISTSAMDADVPLQGPVTLLNGDYNLALAAVPSAQDTLLFAGANDLWKCSLAAGCVWRNTTNATTCMSAQVGQYQHVLAWNAATPAQMLIGNDSGLWRSFDDVGESGSVCASDDASHFDNLNGSLGSLAEIVSLSQVTTSPYTLLAGLGVNGSAGVKSTTGPTAQWPQVLSGEGGPVAIDPTNAAKWYVNNQAGVSIHKCTQSSACTPAAFGTSPSVGESDVAGDGSALALPAPFIVDPLDSTQLIVGTCRVWRGPATGGWTIANDISGFLDHVASGSSCNGNALIRSIAALPLAGGGEVIYVGMYGATDGGETLAGHVFSAVLNPSGTTPPVWHDLTFNPVSNDTKSLNHYTLDVSSIVVDPHDTSGNTIYVGIDGTPVYATSPSTLYGSTDGGGNWSVIDAGLPWSPANAIAVDPQDANTVYVATDEGVYFTRQIGSCATAVCWAPYGTGLPQAPVTQLSASPISVTPSVLVAGTYGRGIWQIPLATAGTQLTSATIDPATLTFAAEPVGSSTATQTVTLTNTGAISLTPGLISISSDFTETDNCQNATIGAGASCTVQVAFAPTMIGARSGQMAVSANVPGGQLSVSLNGTGLTAYNLTVNPALLDFVVAAVGQTSDAQTVTITNPGAVAANGFTLSAAAPFSVLQTTCGAILAADASCTAALVFTPGSLGNVSGAFTISSSNFSQSTVALNGFAGATGSVQFTPASLAFAVTGAGSKTAAQTVTLSNNGSVDLTNLALSVSTGFVLSSTNCTTTLSKGATCTANVLFAPNCTGAVSGTLTVTSSALAYSAQVPLGGTGFDFTVTPSGSSSQTVASGQSATYTLQLTPSAGVPATFSLACGSLPGYATCTTNPASVSVPANATGTVQIQIATGRAVAASRLPRLSSRWAAPLLCGLIVLPAARLRRRRFIQFLILLLAAIAISACSGSGGGGSTGGGGKGSSTPPGTYAIVITTTETCGLAHQITLTLTVD